MKTEEFKVRRLTQEDVEKLSPEDTIFVTADTSQLQGTGCLTPARLAEAGDKFEGGFFDVVTAFGNELSVSCGTEDVGIWVADKSAAETMPVLQSAGLFVNLALFIPGADMNGLYKLFEAIRNEFGQGVVQRWNGDGNDVAVLVPDVKVDVFQVAVRGRKPADGATKRDRVATDIYPQRVPFIPIPDGHKREIAVHTEVTDDTPTI